MDFPDGEKIFLFFFHFFFFFFFFFLLTFLLLALANIYRYSLAEYSGGYQIYYLGQNLVLYYGVLGLCWNPPSPR